MSQTEDLVKSWLEARNLKTEADRIANGARCDLANAINALGKRLLPGSDDRDDAPEQVTVWVPLGEEQEQMLVVKGTRGYGDGDYSMDFLGEKRKI